MLSMEADEIIFEEGEISDDSDGYTPLERPANYSSLQQPNARFPIDQESESESEVQSSDSDSDSDNMTKKSKKPKIKLKPKPQQQKPKNKKYDVWSTRVQEDVLAETLNSCDVTKKDRSRAVESYDYKVFNTRIKNKRSRDDRKNPNIRARGRSRSADKVKATPRIILELEVSSSNSLEEIAKDMANKLCEEKEDLIFKVIGALGIEKSFEIFNETKRLEAEGGMLIMNQSRRRTPGGVFLFLIRHDDDIAQEQKQKIFDEEKQKTRMQIKERQKKKSKKLKEEIAAAKTKLLPDLLTRAELLASQNNRTRKETDDTDVINPPPTPETDGHDNSGDGMDGLIVPTATMTETTDNSQRKLESYDDDFLDINCSNDMDLF